MTIEIKEKLTGSILDIGGGGEAVIGQIYKDRVTAIDNCKEELEEAPDCCSKQLIGRCILVLNRHCGSLSELDISEWTELKTMIDRLERLYKEVLGAELCNWSCLLNDFYKEAVPNPHLHIHVRPRYKNTVVINDHAYTDTEFAHHYALKKESVLLDDDRKILYALMKKHFVL